MKVLTIFFIALLILAQGAKGQAAPAAAPIQGNVNLGLW